MSDSELVNYIKQQLERGVNEQDIKKALLAQGWKEEDVNGGFEDLKPKKQDNGPQTNKEGIKKFFAYAPELPIPVRIVAFLYLIAGVFYMFMGITGFIAASGPVDSSISILFGILSLAISNGLARLKKWAFYLYSAIVLLGFLVNPISSIIALILFIFVFLHRKKFN